MKKKACGIAALALCAGAPVSFAQLTLVPLGEAAPPGSIAGVSVAGFPADARPTFADETFVPAPGGGQVDFSVPMSHRVIGGGWGSWSHGYTGDVYYSNGSAEVDTKWPGPEAMYLYAEPNPFALIEFEIIGTGGGSTESIIESINGSSGAKGYGFANPGGSVDGVRVRTTDTITDFALGEFGISEGGGGTGDALVLDGGSLDDIGVAGAVGAGLTPTVVTTVADFQAQIGGSWTAVVIDVPSLDGALDSIASDLTDYLGRGGKVQMNYWNLDANPALQAVMGVASETDFSTPRGMFPTAVKHPSWGSVASVAPGFDMWADNGGVMTPAGGATVEGEFDATGSGLGAIIVGDSTIMNGHDWDSLDASGTTRQDLATAQLKWLCSAGPVCPPCLADCDESGTLDFFDFLCFQNLFGSGDPCADCDDNGVLDFFDFLCFQNAFAAGCGGGGGITQIGEGAPPTELCGVGIKGIPADPRPTFGDETTVPTPFGDIVFDIACSHRVIGGGWGSWSHGYTGDVYYTNGSNSLTMGLPANKAFYFYAEPNPFALIEFEITDGVDTVVDSINGSSGAKGFGFCGAEKIGIRTTDGVTDFAVGEFGIAN